MRHQGILRAGLVMFCLCLALAMLAEAEAPPRFEDLFTAHDLLEASSYAAGEMVMSREVIGLDDDGYLIPGTTYLEVRITLEYTGPGVVAALGIIEHIPPGWSYAGAVEGDLPDGWDQDGEYVEIYWIYVPGFPCSFTYALDVPAEETGPVSIVGHALYRLNGPEFYSNVVVTEMEQPLGFIPIITDVTSVTVPEGGTASFQVKLGAQPAGTTAVSISRTDGDPDIYVDSGSELTFTPTNWDTYQTVTLRAEPDLDVDDGQAIIQCRGAGLSPAYITPTELDGGVLGILVDSNYVQIAEGSTATFGVKLGAQPAYTVTVSVVRTSGDSDITVEFGASLTFSPLDWDTYQIVTLRAGQDEDTLNGTAVITCRATGLGSAYMNVQELDDDRDTPMFMTREVIGLDADGYLIPGTTYLEFRITLEYTDPDPVTALGIRENIPPGWSYADFVEGDLPPGHPYPGAQSLEFFWIYAPDFPYSMTYALNLPPGETGSFLIEGEALYRTDGPELWSNWVVTQIEIGEPAAPVCLEVEPSTLTIPEGQTATFDVRLCAEPSFSVAVSVAWLSGDTSISVASGSNLNFTASNWAQWQTVTLEAAQDEDTEDGQATIRCSGWGVESTDVLVTEVDNDSTTGNTPPDAPACDIPLEESAHLGLAPLLRASAFSDADPDHTLAESAWRVFDAETKAEVALWYVQGADPTFTRVPEGALESGHRYGWQVSYRDSSGAWSEWSAPSYFTTLGEGIVSHLCVPWYVDNAGPATYLPPRDGGVATLVYLQNNTAADITCTIEYYTKDGLHVGPFTDYIFTIPAESALAFRPVADDPATAPGGQEAPLGRAVPNRPRGTAYGNDDKENGSIVVRWPGGPGDITGQTTTYSGDQRYGPSVLSALLPQGVADQPAALPKAPAKPGLSPASESASETGLSQVLPARDDAGIKTPQECSLGVPWYMDNAGVGKGIPPTDGLVTALVCLHNNTASDKTCTIAYYTKDGRYIGPFTQNSFVIPRDASLVFRPVADDPSTTPGGQETPLGCTVPNRPRGYANGNDNKKNGSIIFHWTGSPTDVQGVIQTYWNPLEGSFADSERLPHYERLEEGAAACHLCVPWYVDNAGAGAYLPPQDGGVATLVFLQNNTASDRTCTIEYYTKDWVYVGPFTDNSFVIPANASLAFRPVADDPATQSGGQEGPLGRAVPNRPMGTEQGNDNKCNGSIVVRWLGTHGDLAGYMASYAGSAAYGPSASSALLPPGVGDEDIAKDAAKPGLSQVLPQVLPADVETLKVAQSCSLRVAWFVDNAGAGQGIPPADGGTTTLVALHNNADSETACTIEYYTKDGVYIGPFTDNTFVIPPDASLVFRPVADDPATEPGGQETLLGRAVPNRPRGYADGNDNKSNGSIVIRWVGTPMNVQGMAQSYGNPSEGALAYGSLLAPGAL